MADERTGHGDIERTLQLLWNPEATSGRGPRRSLSVAAIVDKAVAIADERGLEAVSMRSVAAELGVGAMTLYRYVPGKAELLDLMLDRIKQPIRDRPAPGWRPAMRAWGRQHWSLCMSHRWLPLIDQARPVLGPNAVHALDVMMEALDGSGLTDQEKVSLTITVESLAAALARTANATASAEERTGVSHDEFWQSQEAVLVTAMGSGRYPHMARLSEDSFAASTEEVFEFALQQLLAGVQALLDGRALAPTTACPAEPAGEP